MISKKEVAQFLADIAPLNINAENDRLVSTLYIDFLPPYESQDHSYLWTSLVLDNSCH